ncbi:hypothetical protein, partial [Pseudomonas edaphica]|uniref:hypothetical protein n=1 Tax=Pseudomonas edaphica TaxID=2006980 RepID=UPI001F40E52F
MSPNVEKNRRAWGVYFNASQGVATNGAAGIFSKTCRTFVWKAQISFFINISEPTRKPKKTRLPFSPFKKKTYVDNTMLSQFV